MKSIRPEVVIAASVILASLIIVGTIVGIILLSQDVGDRPQIQLPTPSPSYVPTFEPTDIPTTMPTEVVAVPTVTPTTRPTEMVAVPTVTTTKPITISIIGDSISDEHSQPWTSIFFAAYKNGSAIMINHAKGGATILTDNDRDADMDAQITSAANDNADIAIIELGTNDGNTTDLLREVYENNLKKLKASNPNVEIFCMGILPRGNTVGVAEKDTLIETACKNAGGTYWDTSGWFDPEKDTSDKLHPNETGKQKIADQVLARLQ